MEYKHGWLNDKWVIEDVFPQMKGGFFVEAGAVNGVNGSGTLVLERDYQWQGICVEPIESGYKRLLQWRKSKADNRALYSETGLTLDFTFLQRRSGLSGLTDHLRKSTKKIAEEPDAQAVHVAKETVSLFDLLEQHQAPHIVHYLCLDVEGAEPKILGSFPFNSRFKILAASIEGGFCDEIMRKNGYRSVRNPHSNVAFEHYYVHEDIYSDTRFTERT